MYSSYTSTSCTLLLPLVCHTSHTHTHTHTHTQRGWTTWTVAAVDKRVIGIVPIVMDELNFVKVHQVGVPLPTHTDTPTKLLVNVFLLD